MLEIAGAPAFTAARLEKRLAVLRRANPGVREIAASFAHFVDLAGELDGSARRVLERLLEYGPRLTARPPQVQPQLRLLVVPRIGTISPWSSKATDIARICGLAAVRRIERGTLYILDIALDAAQRERIAALLHDRMTESVLEGPDGADALF